MNFDYNEEQQLLADSVRRYLAKDYGFEARKKILASPEGASGTVWSQLAEIGLLGLPFSTDYGGFGEGDNEHPIGPDYAHRAAPTYFNTRKTTIYGGSNEIQRNIIAKMVLGL